MLVPLEISERNKYAKIWKEKNYSSGNNLAFAKIVIDKINSLPLNQICQSIFEFGVGNGEFLTILKNEVFINGIDITTNQLPEKLKPFVIKAPIWKIPIVETFDFTCSLDVLEHIPPQKIDDTIKEILRLTENVTIHAICTRPALTLLNGENAHLTVKPLSWWQQKFEQHNKNNVKIILLDSDTL